MDTKWYNSLDTNFNQGKKLRLFIEIRHYLYSIITIILAVLGHFKQLIQDQLELQPNF